MVIWLFAGGGETEYDGLVKLLQKEFPDYHFERKLPERAHKPIGKPKRDAHENENKVNATTGPDLLKAISESLSFLLTRKSLEDLLLKGSLCDAILVIDDLDCRQWDGLVCNEIKSPGFLKIQNHYIEQVQRSLDRAKNPLDDWMKNRLYEVQFQPEIIVGFASPEIESWIIADWGKGEEREKCQHRDFPEHQWFLMKRWLQDVAQVDFDNPELYGGFNPETKRCQMKLSEQIMEAATQAQIPQEAQKPSRYNKRRHSSELLEKISGRRVERICPIFKAMYRSLQLLGKGSN
ncbi:hypothetical protein NG799_04320 [Laspinema sp. D1]|uniref:DUF4276 family protein n=1 Tax=Laspinema palackyanum D2a TaxID=2953684 RepID=A0ABT2MLD7_9CYAN|nr:hypothetical protein [Laspinema sp. D2a]